MASELFEKLLAAATRTDCSLLRSVCIQSQQLPGPICTLVAVAEGLDKAGVEFLDAMDRIGQARHLVANADFRHLCPLCGSDRCLGSTVPVPAGYKIHL